MPSIWVDRAGIEWVSRDGILWQPTTLTTAFAFYISTDSTVHAMNTRINDITNYALRMASPTVYDITELDATATQFIPGLQDSGQCVLTANYSATDAGQQYMRTSRAGATKRAFDLLLGDDSVSHLTFEGYVFSITNDVSVDNAIKSSIVIEITGGVTFG
jgi:hypothetical protein